MGNIKFLSVGAFLFCLQSVVCFVMGAEAPDFSKSKCWLYSEKKPLKTCDVFYMHPTTYRDFKDGANADIDNAEARKGAEETLKRQAWVFKESCNIYAPHYRQVSRQITKKLPFKECYKCLDIAVEDMRKAFVYYLKNHNHGRPYILAGHSQGATVMLEFLRKYGSLIDRKKLIAVYMVGWTITTKDLKDIGLPLAVCPDQFGGVITWNTIGKGGKSPSLNPGALCVNPLSWTADVEEQPKSKNIYAEIFISGKDKMLKIPHFTSARIGKQGGLIIPTPAPVVLKQLSMEMGPNVYHAYDYDFFHGNIAENAAVRCKAWQNKAKK